MVYLKGYYEIILFFDYFSLLSNLAKSLMGLMKNIQKHYDMNKTLHFDFFQWIFQGFHSPESLVLLISSLNHKKGEPCLK
jgi:hypothetical protein